MLERVSAGATPASSKILNRDSGRCVKHFNKSLFETISFSKENTQQSRDAIGRRKRRGSSSSFSLEIEMIISHDHAAYRKKWQTSGVNQYNGAFYYSKEIVKNIIPNVKTNRNWITVNVHGAGCDDAIVFIHNNLHPERYEWLRKYNNLVLVCGVKETVKKVEHLGHAIYIPLSIDTEYVKQFRVEEKTKDVAFVGRRSKRRLGDLPDGIDYLQGIRRQKLLPMVAEYRSVYAVGRSAIEAVCLGCKVLPYDKRFPNPSVWKVLDNKDAARMLQRELDRIDGRA